jgi:hypothetical protein
VAQALSSAAEAAHDSVAISTPVAIWRNFIFISSRILESLGASRAPRRISAIHPNTVKMGADGRSGAAKVLKLQRIVMRCRSASCAGSA